MPEDNVSCLRYDSLLLTEAEDIHRLIPDSLCILNVERLTDDLLTTTESEQFDRFICDYLCF